MASRYSSLPLSPPGVYKRRTAGFTWLRTFAEMEVYDAITYNSWTQRVCTAKEIENPESNFIPYSNQSWKKNFIKNRKETFAKNLKRKLNAFDY